MLDIDQLHDFILAAKAATYVGGGSPVESCRPNSHDLTYTQGDWVYLDSYFGGSSFIGEEVVYFKDQPVWGMNYHGYLLKPEKFTAAEAGKMIKASLSGMYAEGRFLGGWEHRQGDLTYRDTSTGDLTRFTGREWIDRAGERVYELIYHGGVIA